MARNEVLFHGVIFIEKQTKLLMLRRSLDFPSREMGEFFMLYLSFCIVLLRHVEARFHDECDSNVF